MSSQEVVSLGKLLEVLPKSFVLLIDGRREYVGQIKSFRKEKDGRVIPILDRVFVRQTGLKTEVGPSYRAGPWRGVVASDNHMCLDWWHINLNLQDLGGGYLFGTEVFTDFCMIITPKSRDYRELNKPFKTPRSLFESAVVEAVTLADGKITLVLSPQAFAGLLSDDDPDQLKNTLSNEVEKRLRKIIS